MTMPTNEQDLRREAIRRRFALMRDAAPAAPPPAAGGGVL